MRKSKRVKCPNKECYGVTWDVTSKLAAHLGQKHIKCDKCGDTFVIQTSNTTKDYM